MGEDIDGHFGGESAYLVEMRVHVAVGSEALGQIALESVHQRAVVQMDSVQRSDAMIEARDQVRGYFAPERVVPTELAGAQHREFVENVEVGANAVYVLDRSSDIAGDVIGYAWPNAARTGALDERPDLQGPVGHGRVCMTIDRSPGHPCPVCGPARAVSGRIRVVSGRGRLIDESRGVNTGRPPRPAVVSRLGMAQVRVAVCRVAESRADREGCGTGIDTWGMMLRPLSRVERGDPPAAKAPVSGFRPYWVCTSQGNIGSVPGM